MNQYTLYASDVSDLTDLVPEQDKNKPAYLIAKAQDLIHRLVIGRPDLRRARDLYEGRRNPEKFKYLTDTMGVGNPGTVPFIPLMRNRIQVLKGKFLDAGIPHQIACSDSYSLGTYEQERHDWLMQRVLRMLTADLAQRVQQAGQGQEPGAPAQLHEAQLQRLQEESEDFQSSIEIGAAHVLKEIIGNPDIKMRTKLETHLENLLVDRSTFFQTTQGEPGLLSDHEVINAGELYHNAPAYAKDLDMATAVVRRRLIPISLALSEYGHMLSAEERRTMVGDNCIGRPWKRLPAGGEKYLDYLYSDQAYPEQYREWLRKQDGPTDDLVEVYHVQWKASNPVDLNKIKGDSSISANGELVGLGSAALHLSDDSPDLPKKLNQRWREDLYEVVQIGSSIYCCMGKVQDPVRPEQKPWTCRLSYRGYMLDISLVLSTEDLQDKSDIAHYIAENIAHNSGTSGMMVPVNDIPAELGEDVIDRMMMALQYKKQGILPINPMQQGGTKGQFSNYQTYDDTLKGTALDGITKLLEFYDNTASNITGINRQMLGSIEERDGVGNTQQAVVQSTLITKPIFEVFDRLTGDALTDMLNSTRRSFAANNASTMARLILGEGGRRVYTIDAKKFSLAHYRVLVSDGRKEADQLKTLQQLGVELAQGQLLPPVELVEAIFSTSVTNTRRRMKAALSGGQGKQLAEMQQALEEAQQQLKQVQGELQKALGNADQYEQQRVANETKEVQIKQQVADDTAAKNQTEGEVKKGMLALERDQIAFSEQAKPVNKSNA